MANPNCCFMIIAVTFFSPANCRGELWSWFLGNVLVKTYFNTQCPPPTQFSELTTALSQWCCVYVIVGVIFCTHLNLSLLLLCWSNIPDVAISRQIGDFLRWIESKLGCQLLFLCIRKHIPMVDGLWTSKFKLYIYKTLFLVLCIEALFFFLWSNK